MALLTAQGIARVAIPLLSRMLVLPQTVTRVPEPGFAPPNGQTISVRVRTPRSARTQSTAGAAITYDDQNEIEVPVTLSHLYDAYHVTDEDMSLALEDFASQITEPQVQSIAIGAEDTVAAAMNALAVDTTIEFAATATQADTRDTILAIREALSDAEVPVSDRFLAVSPQIATRVLQLDEVHKVNEAGSSSALRDAVIARTYGFTIVESAALTDDTCLGYHRSGFVMASKRPADPRGATDTATYSEAGINIRQIFQYDPDVLSDASVLSTFAGAAAVFENAASDDFSRIVKVGVGST